MPVALGCDLPDLKIEAALNETQRAALSADLKSSREASQRSP
jgi:hypothetical protein